MARTRILVVEDEAIIARDIMLVLARLGFEPIGPMATGEQAIRTVQQERPGLVLMDIHLAGAVDGIAAATEIHDRFGTPVIFLTASSDEVTVKAAEAVEPLGFLVKPFDEVQLRDVLKLVRNEHG